MICPVKHGPGFQTSFDFTECIFNFPELFVVKNNFTTCHAFNIGNDSEETVFDRFLFDGLLIELAPLVLVNDEIFFVIGIGNKVF